MRIWIDADACPNLIKEILYKASKRTQIPLVLVANSPITTPPSPLIKKIIVSAGFDMADNYIVNELQVGELVITADIPLADAVIEKGGLALNPRGELYSAANIKQRLAIRNLSETLRSNGMISGGPPKIGKKEVQAFANSLDRVLQKVSIKK